VGPGPNYFSDSTNNVWVDSEGQLHLRITNRSNEWQCAEVVTARTFGYGHYRFELNSRVDNLDPNVVLGLFTWSDDSAYSHREMDIECSRWSNAADANNAQFVVQPFDLAGHLIRYAVPTALADTTHVFRWITNEVDFQSQRGSYSPIPAGANTVSNWAYTLTVPQTGDENVRINLWLSGGLPPTNNREVEVVIKGFEFVPLGTPQPALITNWNSYPGGQTHFAILAQPDRRYRVQTTADLFFWRDLARLLATNPVVEFLDASPASSEWRAFRAVTLP
jgi:hypothetical protein